MESFIKAESSCATMEDVLLCECWVQVSPCPVTANEMKFSHMWRKIHGEFCERSGLPRTKMALDSRIVDFPILAISSTWFVDAPYASRRKDALLLSLANLYYCLNWKNFDSNQWNWKVKNSSIHASSAARAFPVVDPWEVTEERLGGLQIQLKLVPGNPAGTVTAYYLSSQGQGKQRATILSLAS
ncbi:hypothetical protein L3X38_024974 [Prunus dulcis]|uniref:Uncharacterized protein n=1 Tax=Prunus dulcis TaxID=3755 RepID=A0AAD4W1M5_PRUDU|nr:hypothetical protein L3X38_024974 [Prunus dulcis]